MTQVSEDAIEAAFSALLDRGIMKTLHLSNPDIRAMLEAAAPHLMADAWDRGFAEGWDCEGSDENNPYRRRD